MSTVPKPHPHNTPRPPCARPQGRRALPRGQCRATPPTRPALQASHMATAGSCLREPLRGVAGRGVQPKGFRGVGGVGGLVEGARAQPRPGRSMFSRLYQSGSLRGRGDAPGGATTPPQSLFGWARGAGGRGGGARAGRPTVAMAGPPRSFVRPASPFGRAGVRTRCTRNPPPRCRTAAVAARPLSIGQRGPGSQVAGARGRARRTGSRRGGRRGAMKGRGERQRPGLAGRGWRAGAAARWLVGRGRGRYRGARPS
jgi:hypothetical protein